MEWRLIVTLRIIKTNIYFSFILNLESYIFFNLFLINIMHILFIEEFEWIYLGRYNNIKDKLPKQFSIFQFMSISGIDALEVRNARNILKQFSLKGKVKRLSKNMYQNIESNEKWNYWYFKFLLISCINIYG